jgi:hypothetical protein
VPGPIGIPTKKDNISKSYTAKAGSAIKDLPLDGSKLEI